MQSCAAAKAASSVGAATAELVSTSASPSMAICRSPRPSEALPAAAKEATRPGVGTIPLAMRGA